MIFNPELSVSTENHIEHIFNKNKNRILSAYGQTEERWQECQQLFRDELTKAFKSAKYNYRLPTPQYYEDQIQYLLPLYHTKGGARVVVLAAAVKYIKDEKGRDASYEITTVLPTAWAYNNARLLGRIESNWLNIAEFPRENEDDSDDDDNVSQPDI